METKELDKSTMEEAMKNLTKELERTFMTQSTIKREGDQIVIPSFMSYKDAANAIISYEKDMEKEENKISTFEGHISDMLVALHTVMVKIFGNAIGNTIHSFFGSIPGALRINIDWDKAVTVPFGRIEIPGLPVIFEVSVSGNPHDAMKSRMQVVSHCKRKYMPLSDRIADGVRDELSKNSIFKGKAINSRFEFLNVNGFDVSRIIHSQQEELDIEANILSMIKYRDEISKTNISLKRTVLLHGKYGTGKTLTALKVAKTCREHGWSFMNVVPGDNNFAAALNYASKYQPCVVFFEDIDQVTSGERDSTVNEILNTVDGILSKSSQVLTILTSNHIERVERAMLRPGRIDAVIELGTIDAIALEKLIRSYCKDQITDLDPISLLPHVEGYTPAFVAEGCQRAILYAKAKGQNIVTQDAIMHSLIGLRSQYNMMLSDRNVKDESIDSKFKKIIKEAQMEAQ